jgi:prevent-host-death family protein
VDAVETIPLTNVRNDFIQLAEKTAQFGDPVRITSDKGDVVILSASDWDAIQETLFLNANPKVRDSILEGMRAPQSDFVEDIGWDIS